MNKHSSPFPAFLTRYAQTQVTTQILPFWSHQVMQQRSGLLGAVNVAGQAIAGAPKGAIMNARLLWSLSLAAVQTGETGYLESAQRCYDGFVAHFVDTDNHGIYWALSADNQPLDTQKNLLAHSYAIFALSQYYLASNNPNALLLAQDLSLLIAQRFEREDGTYCGQFSQHWQADNNDHTVTETCNQLHVLEALTLLYSVKPSAVLKNRLTALIDLFLVHIFPASDHLALKFDRHWNPIGQQRSFGHNVEAPFLVALACEAIADDIRLKLANIHLQRLVDLTLTEGTENGGNLLNGCDVNGQVDTLMSWWPQVELSNALYWLSLDTNNEKYPSELEKCWDRIQNHWVDTNNGEWHSELDLNLRPAGTQNKADIWRSAYHSTRACFLLAHGKSALTVENNTKKPPEDTRAPASAELAVGINF